MRSNPAVWPLKIIAFLVAMVLLNALITAHSWFPDRRWAGVALLSLETGGFLLAVLGAASLGRRLRLPLIAFLTLAGAWWSLYSGGEALMRYVYGRGLHPRTDIGFVADGVGLLFPELEAPHSVITPAVLALLAVAALILIGSVVVGLSGLLRSPGGPLSGTVSLALLVAVAATVGFSEPIADDMASGFRFTAEPSELLSSEEQLLADRVHQPDASEEDDAAFPRLRDRDVHVFFVESYGYTAFSREELRRELTPFLFASEQKLTSAGYAMRSTFLRSPVAGGWSWLAEATFLTGLYIDDEKSYEELLRSGATSIPRMFDDAGYQTALVMPAVQEEGWTEGQGFYSFDELLFAPFFDYVGPRFQFTRVPDQFAIYNTYRHLKNDTDSDPAGPVFVEYVLASSHAPFNRIPPYIDDWNALGDGSIYHERAGRNFDNGYFSGKEYDEGYTAAIEYVLTTIREHLLDHVAGDDALVVIVGDHQPMRPVRTQDAPLSVPVHVLSRDAALLAPLAQYGYEPGLVPTGEPPHAGMEQFLTHFLAMIGKPHTSSSETHE